MGADLKCKSRSILCHFVCAILGDIACLAARGFFSNYFCIIIKKRRLTQIDNMKVINRYGYYIFEINNQQLAK